MHAFYLITKHGVHAQDDAIAGGIKLSRLQTPKAATTSNASALYYGQPGMCAFSATGACARKGRSVFLLISSSSRIISAYVFLLAS